MVRRSKEDALATRTALLDAAERVFPGAGRGRHFAQRHRPAAGTTRGAIYWHFKDKADLFNAMMDRVSMPLEGAMLALESAHGADPLPALRQSLRQALHQTVTDPQTRRVFEVATHMVEYVDSLCAVRERHLRQRSAWVERIRLLLLKSAATRGVRLPVAAATAAQGLQAMMDGLIQNWLLDPGAFDLEACGTRSVDTYRPASASAEPPLYDEGSRRCPSV
ncbi:TetR family transcriptional regulator [Ramlibacter terrae]|uniref:TetR family transcriptional regulator n=1 Tax=Ramlibacter terrae TaxID=2732511 RepID=A0ABX6P1E8_9BURK|nr:TetR family transcriptional regulator [Ramlibacter terrae]